MVADASSLAGHLVRRMGFGAMQLPGPGVFGPPRDRSQALEVLRTAVDSGVNHIDTAQFYGPDVANEILHEALHPYPEDLVLVSKVGAVRDEQGHWLAAQRPEELRSGVEANLASLELDQIPAVNLRRHPDSDGPLLEQLEAMTALPALGSRWPASRTPTTWPIAPGRMCSTPVARTRCPLCRSSHSDPPSVPTTPCSARPRSGRPLAASVPGRPRSPWLGSCTRDPTSCSFRERPRWTTSRRIWRLATLPSTLKRWTL